MITQHCSHERPVDLLKTRIRANTTYGTGMLSTQLQKTTLFELISKMRSFTSPSFMSKSHNFISAGSPVHPSVPRAITLKPMSVHLPYQTKSWMEKMTSLSGIKCRCIEVKRNNRNELPVDFQTFI